MLYTQTTLNCNGHLIDIEKPIVMGILNITPDSFYAESRVTTEKEIVERAEVMLTEGATILDIGGMSSRPGAVIISEEEELARTVPAIKAIVKQFPKAVLSIDTVRASVARACVEAGASVINDISAGSLDATMFRTVADLKNIPYIVMHMKGTPETMQKQADYTDVALEILDFMIEKVGQLRGLYVKDIIIDPGFGFGKTIEHNYELLRKLHVLKILDVPILAGLSRKTMLWKYLDTTPEDVLNATSVCNYVALQQGAQILRVHDVKEAIQTIKLYEILHGL